MVLKSQLRYTLIVEGTSGAIVSEKDENSRNMIFMYDIVLLHSSKKENK